jgi:hypothetical protein
VYRWAQLDDYLTRRRRQFPWQAPFHLRLQARVSHADLPGTWGVGLWNDPFSLNLGLGGAVRRLPALPNTAWFFYAGHPNYLSLRDDLPAQGFLAATFRSPAWNPHGITPITPSRSFRDWVTRRIRWLASWFIGQSGCQVGIDPTAWHTYEIDWFSLDMRRGEKASVIFRVDGEEIFQTPVSPRGRLGLVLWIDNQYAAFPPDGPLKFGTSPSPHPAWLEIKDFWIA